MSELVDDFKQRLERAGEKRGAIIEMTCIKCGEAAAWGAMHDPLLPVQTDSLLETMESFLRHIAECWAQE